MRQFYNKLSAFYDKHGAICFGIIAFALMVFVLFCGRTIGLSNNGDFQRVMNASSIQFGDDAAAFTFSDTYTINLTEQTAIGNVSKILFGAEGYSKYPSLQVPLVRVSVVLNLILNKLTGSDMSAYRLEVLGVVCCALYAAVLAFLTAQFRLNKRFIDIVSKTLILIVLCDVGYLTYFNSFYGEALQIIALVFLAAMLVRIILHKPGLKDAVLCALGCVVFGWSKFFNIPAACVFAVLLTGLILTKTKQKSSAVVGFITLITLAVIYFSIPSWMSLQTKFNAIFFGALRETDITSSEKYLNELGLPSELAKYRNTNIYVDGVAAELENSGFDKTIMSVSNIKIAAFYLKHPDRMFNALSITLLNSGSIRPFYLSNYNSDLPKLTFSHRFSLWSDIRTSAGFDTWAGFIGVILVFGLAVIILMRRSGRKWYETTLVLVVLAGILAYFFIVPFLSNGEGDLAKHLFAYTQMTDLMVLFVIAAALHELSGKKFGLLTSGCLLMALCLAYTPVKTEISRIIGLTRTHDGLDVGAYVLYGRNDDKNMVWQVAENGGGSITLINTGAVGDDLYSLSGSSDWESSSLRDWLNTAFLTAFSKQESARLLLTDNTVLLSRETKKTSTSGNSDFYFSPIPLLASRGYRDSYQTVVGDIVTLPDIDLITKMTENGMAITLKKTFWLETPYFNNGYMARCVMPDGYILLREVTEPAGVRPVIHISISDVKSGSGCYTDPYILD